MMNPNDASSSGRFSPNTLIILEKIGPKESSYVRNCTFSCTLLSLSINDWIVELTRYTDIFHQSIPSEFMFQTLKTGLGNVLLYPVIHVTVILRGCHTHRRVNKIKKMIYLSHQITDLKTSSSSQEEDIKQKYPI